MKKLSVAMMLAIFVCVYQNASAQTNQTGTKSKAHKSTTSSKPNNNSMRVGPTSGTNTAIQGASSTGSGISGTGGTGSSGSGTSGVGKGGGKSGNGSATGVSGTKKPSPKE